MIDRVDRAGGLRRRPLALPSTHVPAPIAARAGSVLSIPLGEVAGALHAIALDEKTRCATYELLVANETPNPLATFAYASEAPRIGNIITWNAIVVPPFSAIAITVDVTLPRRGSAPRVVAELHGEEAQLTLDADPPNRHARGLARRATLLASALFLLALGGASVAGTKTQVFALGAPETVRAGSPFSVAYALGHATDAEYSVETPDGMQVRRGKLEPGSGAFTLRLPTAPLSSGYDVSIMAHGRFGSDARTTHVVALGTETKPAGRPAPVARLDDVALENDSVKGGEPIAVDYRANSRTGSVRLIDELGTVRAEALLRSDGRSVLVAPYVDADQDFRVVIDVEHGPGHAQAEVPVRVLRSLPDSIAQSDAPRTSAPTGVPVVVGENAQPGGPATQTAQGAPGNSPTVDASADNAPFAVAPVQAAGQSIVVAIVRHEPDLHVALMGSSGTELVGQDVAADETSVVLAAPEHPPTGRMAIVATFTKGFGQETVIRPITLTSR
jgi:hypothetical protein